jgi:hypothetical protein
MSLLPQVAIKAQRNPFWPERYPDESFAEYKERRAVSRTLVNRGVVIVAWPKQHRDELRNTRRKAMALVGPRQFKKLRRKGIGARAIINAHKEF